MHFHFFGSLILFELLLRHVNVQVFLNFGNIVEFRGLGVLKPVQWHVVSILETDSLNGFVVCFGFEGVVVVVFVENHLFCLEESIDGYNSIHQYGHTSSRESKVIVTLLVVVPSNMMTKHVLLLDKVLDFVFTRRHFIKINDYFLSF